MGSIRTLHGLIAFACALFAAAGAVPAAAQQQARNVDYDMYFNSAWNNDPSCAMDVVEGRIAIAPAVTNAAMSCPDMLAWKVFVEAVSQDFIGTWAGGDLMWPAAPYPLCPPGGGTACCTPGSTRNPGYQNPADPSLHCPFYPGGRPQQSAAAQLGGRRRDTSRLPNMPEFHGSQSLQTTSLSFFNESMFDYVFKNNLYNSTGLVTVFNNGNRDLTRNAPYRAWSGTGALTTIAFAIDAWMVRSQWMERSQAIAAGLVDDPSAPFVKVIIGARRPYSFNPASFPPGEYWLISFHISTKDIPAWFWADFDHVSEPGRCDFTGCNDSYGYWSATPADPALLRNFTPPATQPGKGGQAYAQNAIYPSGDQTDGLRTVFRKMGIGVGDRAGEMPKPSDRAWLSYRLRGTQWDFTDTAGRAAYAGATVSNGGIMTGSSCISCHATSGTLATGPSPQILGLYNNWAGAPNPANFNLNARPALYLIVQNDFVWGFLHTVPLAQDAKTPRGGR